MRAMENIVIYASGREAMGKHLTEKELKELREKLAHEKLSNIISLRTPPERQRQAAEHGPMHWWVGSAGTGAGISFPE